MGKELTMKITKIKPLTDRFLNLIFVIWGLILVVYIFTFQGGFLDPVGGPFAIAILSGLLINILLFYRFKRECDQGKHYLLIEKKKILYHGTNVFGKERITEVVVFDNFHTFSVEKTLLFGNAIILNTIIGGKKRILFSGNVYEKDSEEILMIIQKAQSEK